ncbi:DNA replication endonuclease-helicase Dna2 [Binucleata daphniae]
MFEEYDISTFIVQEISKQKDSIVLSSEKIRLIVKDEWTNIKYHKGMKISFFCCVCNACNANKNVNTYIVDRNNNMLMIEDELISVTSFCTVFKCDYKPVLSSYVLDLSFTYNHSSLVIGIIIHTVIEKCISSGFVLKSIVKNIKDEINNNIKLMYTCNVDEKYVIVECMKYVKHILSIKEYLDKIQCDYKSDKNVVEKKITSQKYGLRGIIDALLVGKNGTIITEIKTGKKIDIAHRAQVLMYYLMMKDKVCKLSDKMLLFYAFEGKYVNIIPKHEELMHMIIKRNIITSLKYISKNNIKDTENILGNEFIADCRCNDNEYCKKISLMHQIIHEYEDNHIDVIKTKIDCEDTTKIRSVNQQGAEINNIKQRHIVTEQEYKMAKWMKEQ